jgi:hypothetical protein
MAELVAMGEQRRLAVSIAPDTVEHRDHAQS